MVASSQKARQEEFEAISVAAAQKLQTAASEKEKKADEKKAELVRQGGIECRRKRVLPKHADLAPNWHQALIMNRVRLATSKAIRLRLLTVVLHWKNSRTKRR